MSDEKSFSSDKSAAAAQPGVLREYSSASPEPKIVQPAEPPAEEPVKENNDA